MTQIATPDTARPLTAKRQRFVEEYLVDLNATQAAVRAGYSEHTAGEIGAENLGIPQFSKPKLSGQNVPRSPLIASSRSWPGSPSRLSPTLSSGGRTGRW